MSKTGWVLGMPPNRWIPSSCGGREDGSYRKPAHDASVAERHEVFHTVTVSVDIKFPEGGKLESADCGEILYFLPWRKGDALPRYYEICQECVAVLPRAKLETGKWKQVFVHERHLPKKAPV